MPRKWAAALAALATLACVESGASSAATETVEPFPDAASSLESLGAGVLQALALGDIEALETFRLTEAEHNEVVWPELPASAPEVNFPVDMAWSNIQARNRSALVRIVPDYDGGKPSFSGTECRGDPQRFVTFVVLTDCWILFRLDGTAQPLEAQLFEDVLVRGGGYKIFRYYDEEPRPRHSPAADRAPSPGRYR